MKKLLLVIFLFIFCMPVYASNVTTNLTGVSNIDAGGEFELTLNINGNNVWGFVAKLNYDSSKLTLVSYEGMNGFNAMVGTNIVLDRLSGANGNTSVIKLKFKANKGFVSGESTVISLTNVSASSDTVKFNGVGCEKNITVNIPKSTNSNLYDLKIDGKTIDGFSKDKKNYNLGVTDLDKITISAIQEDSKATISGVGELNLKYGENTFKIIVKAENGSTSTYIITINKKDTRSNNNYLSSLTISSGELKFNKSVNTYNVVVENKVDNITINAKTEDSKALLTGIGSKKLNVYANSFEIVVTAENGSKRSYKINVSRKDKDGNIGNLSDNNNLSKLEIKGYNIEFNKDILNYNIIVENNIDKIDIDAVVEDKNASVDINNKDILSIGENEITIVVTAQNGNKKTYKIMVMRKDDSIVTTIDKLKDVISKNNSKIVTVEIKDDINNISKDIIDELSKKNIILNVNKYKEDKILYKWVIDGKKIDKSFEFNTLVNLDSKYKNEIDKLTNYVDAIYLDYSYSGELPKDTEFSLYVGDKYNNGDKLKLYYYDVDNNNMILEEDELVVSNGYVKYKIEHCSNYVLTQALLNEEIGNGFDIEKIIIIIQGVIILFMICYYIFIDKKLFSKKKNVENI